MFAPLGICLSKGRIIRDTILNGIYSPGTKYPFPPHAQGLFLFLLAQRKARGLL